MILAVALFTVQLLAGAYHTPVQVHHGEYFPLRDDWERRKPADVGMDAAKLNAAVEFMKSHETTAPARFFRPGDHLRKAARFDAGRAGSDERFDRSPWLHRCGVRRHQPPRSD